MDRDMVSSHCVLSRRMTFAPTTADALRPAHAFSRRWPDGPGRATDDVV